MLSASQLFKWQTCVGRHHWEVLAVHHAEQVGFCKGSQVANQSEDHFFQANNAKVLCSQGVLKPSGKGVVHSQKCVCGQGVPRNVGWVTSVTLLSCLWQVTFGSCIITKQKYEWALLHAGIEVWCGHLMLYRKPQGAHRTKAVGS